MIEEEWAINGDEVETTVAELEDVLTEAGEALEAELKDLGEDLETIDWADQT